MENLEYTNKNLAKMYTDKIQKIKLEVSLNSIMLEPVNQDRRSMFWDYLLLADESEEVVKQYMHDGEMFAICYEEIIVGIVLFTFHSNHIVELKNIAIGEEYQGRGFGKLVVNEAFNIYQTKGFQKMIVGRRIQVLPT